MNSGLILSKQTNRINKIIEDNFIDAEREMIHNRKLASDYSVYEGKTVYNSNQPLIKNMIKKIKED